MEKFNPDPLGMKTIIIQRVLFPTRKEAEKTLNTLIDTLHNYGVVTVADFYDASGVLLQTTYKESMYGWRELNGAIVCNTKTCYELIMPPPVLLERGPMNQDVKNEQVNDNVNHPSHYTSGKIEVIDFITDQKLTYCLGNAVKYVARAGKKNPDKTIEDLQKAVWYINKEIDLLKNGDSQIQHIL